MCSPIREGHLICLTISPAKQARTKGKLKKSKESDARLGYPASELEEDAEGREDDGEDDLDAGGGAHDRSPLFLALMNRWMNYRSSSKLCEADEQEDGVEKRISAGSII